MRSLAIAASVVKTAVFRQIFDSRLPPDGLGIQAHQIQEFRGDVTPHRQSRWILSIFGKPSTNIPASFQAVSAAAWESHARQ